MSVNLGERVSVTLRNYSDTIADNITNHNALLNRLMSKGQMMDDDSGGRNHAETLMYAENGMYKWYSGLESFNIVEEEVIDTAEFERKYLGTFIYFSGKDKTENKGKHAIQNLMKARTKVAVQTLKNQVATSLYSDGTSSKQIGGLRLLVDDDPTSAGTVGGIDQAASTGAFWRNQYTSATTLNTTTVRGLLNTRWLSCIRGADKPDLLLGDDDWYTAYEGSLQENIRYTTSKMADAGFEAIKFKSADFVYDDQCPDKRCYMLNTDYLSLKCPSDRKFTVGKNRTVTNADYDVVPIFFAGALCTSNRSLQGVLIAS
jgi:hypothetical protein